MVRRRNPKRVLIVDDDRKMAECLADMIEIFNVDYTTVENGEQAIDLLNNDSFHLVIADSRMPKISGFTLLKYVKQNHPDTRVAIVSTRNSEMTQSLAVRDKADFYLPRPFKTKDLESILDKIG